MSVVNRLEIANFLNLDNRLPHEPGWEPHYPHLCLNFRGASSAVLAANGTGKTTLNCAIYALLTRERTFVQRIKQVAAPNRFGAYSHIRLEVLFKDQPDDLLGQVGLEVQGEPYVFGVYLNAEDSPTFYYFQGRLEDCPVAITEDCTITIVDNPGFIEALKSIPGVARGVKTDEWRTIVQDHFDAGLLGQLVSYQKAGGGDSTKDFFPVSLRDSTGRHIAYDTAVFYEYLAPEILANAMKGEGLPGEIRFEDTIKNSAQPIIRAELEHEKREKELGRAKASFEALESLDDDLRAFTEARARLDRQVDNLAGEAALIFDITEKNPLPGVPRPLTDQSEQTQLVANGLVLVDGGWRVPDNLLAKLFGTDTAHVNQTAQRADISAIKIRQAIEIPWDIKTKRDSRGKENRAYTLDEARTLIRARTVFADGWTQDAALRALNHGFQYRTGPGEPNQFRLEANSAHDKLVSTEDDIKQSRASLADARQTHRELGLRVEALEADAFELQQIRQSGLFDAAELEALESLEETTKKDHRVAVEKLYQHKERRAKLHHLFEEHKRLAEEFPDRQPGEVRIDLEEKVLSAVQEDERAADRLEAAKQDLGSAKRQREHARTALAGLQKNVAGLQDGLRALERFEEFFPSESPQGLAPKVIDEHGSAIDEQAELRAQIRDLEDEVGRLSALESSWTRFREQFPDRESARGVTDYVREQQGVAQRTSDKLDSDLAAARKDQDTLQALNNTWSTATNTLQRDVAQGAEEALRQEYDELRTLSAELERKLEAGKEEHKALAAFQDAFGEVDPATSQEARRARHGAACVEESERQSDRADSLRQAKELESAATAAGPFAAQALAALGGAPKRVYQVIDEELPVGDPRRERVLPRFSQVLHAPVSETPEDARPMLEILDRENLEIPVFWGPALRRHCNEASEDDGDDVRSLLVGAETLQVQGLLYPAKVAEQKERLKTRITELDALLESLREEVADLHEDSERSRIVARACDAIQSSLYTEINTISDKQARVAKRLEALGDLLSESFLSTLRDAVEFELRGGAQALEDQSERVAQLQADIENTAKVRAHWDKIAEGFEGLREAEKFEEAGGAARLSAAKEERVNAVNRKAEIEAALPRLTKRRNSVSLIEGATEFLEKGGRDRISALKGQIEAAEADVSQAETAAKDAETSVAEAQKVRDAALKTLQNIRLEESRLGPIISKAIRFEEEGGPSFFSTYEEEKGRLAGRQELTDRRRQFRFVQAARALSAEQNGDTAVSLRDQRNALEREIAQVDEKIAQLENLHQDLVATHKRAEAEARRLDAAIIEILARRRDARRAVADADLTLERIARAPKSEALEGLHQLVEAVRVVVATGDEPMGDVLARIEDISGAAQDLEFSVRISDIRGEVRAKDGAWKKFLKSLQQTTARGDVFFSDAERRLLRAAEEQSKAHSITAIMQSREQDYVRARENYEKASEDIEARRSSLEDNLLAFTFKMGDNLALLKKSLRPSANGEAGFIINAESVSQEQIRETIYRIVRTVKEAEVRKREIKAGDGGKAAEDVQDEKLRDEIRRTIYRSMFTGKMKDGTAPKPPEIKVVHPKIAAGNPRRMDQKISTGQMTAISLLLMTKLADFSIRRDEADALPGQRRRRRNAHNSRVVIIDGLFSNVSDRQLIRESLDAMRQLKDRFQLIGWIHNMAYENDPEIFPTQIGLRRVGAERGFVVVDQQNSKGELFYGPGSVASQELHIDRRPEGPRE